jgi:putative FmdB family regulatory protein
MSMPIYEYRCPACGSDFEKMQKFTDPTPSCPTCGAAEVKKKVSASAFVLKGSGWYKDHYGLKKGTADAGKGEGGSSEPSKPAAGASDGGSSGGASPSSSSATPSSSGGSSSAASSS